LELLGFEFGDFGFAGNRVHFQINIPKKYSIEDTEVILKSETSKRMFIQAPWIKENGIQRVLFGVVMNIISRLA